MDMSERGVSMAFAGTFEHEITRIPDSHFNYNENGNTFIYLSLVFASEMTKLKEECE